MCGKWRTAECRKIHKRIDKDMEETIIKKYSDNIKLQKEFVILTVAEYNNKEFTIIKKIFAFETHGEAYKAFIDKEIQMLFLKYCYIYEYVPVLIHSHVKYHTLGFSSQDGYFEKAMNFIQKKLWNRNTLISILCGNGEYTCRLIENNQSKYFPIENTDLGKYVENIRKQEQFFK